MGYILLQEEKDGRKLFLKAGSMCLNGAESRYAVVELELCGLVWVVLKLRLYLQGWSFTVITDHKLLVGIFKKALGAQTNKRIVNLFSKVSHLQFNGKWTAGKANIMADALSRSPVHRPQDDEEELGGSEVTAAAAAPAQVETMQYVFLRFISAVCSGGGV